MATVDEGVHVAILDRVEADPDVTLAQAKYGATLKALLAMIPPCLWPLVNQLDEAHGAAICQYAVAGHASAEVIKARRYDPDYAAVLGAAGEVVRL